MIEKLRCSVIGYGSWATTLVGKLARKGNRVSWLVTNAVVSEGIACSGRNPKYVSDMDLDNRMIDISDDIDEVVSNSDILLLACPSVLLKKNLDSLTVPLSGKTIVSAVKGIVPDDNVPVLEYMHASYAVPYDHLAVISGPSHAEEVSRGKLSFLSVACSSVSVAEEIASLFADDSLLVDVSTDAYGIECASVLKNVYAIASGLATGLGYGDNFLAVLIAACAAEMRRYLDGSCPASRNTDSRAYLGDLLVTCYSNYSRNRRLGQLIGKGCTVKSAINEMTMVAEGYFSSNCIHSANMKHNIPMPVADMVYDILYGNASPRKAMAKLVKLI